MTSYAPHSGGLRSAVLAMARRLLSFNTAQLIDFILQKEFRLSAAETTAIVAEATALGAVADSNTVTPAAATGTAATAPAPASSAAGTGGGGKKKKRAAATTPPPVPAAAPAATTVAAVMTAASAAAVSSIPAADAARGNKKAKTEHSATAASADGERASEAGGGDDDSAAGDDADSSAAAGAGGKKKKPKPGTKAFDWSRYARRHIALKIAYIGHNYNGFASQNGLDKARARQSEIAASSTSAAAAAAATNTAPAAMSDAGDDDTTDSAAGDGAAVSKRQERRNRQLAKAGGAGAGAAESGETKPKRTSKQMRAEANNAPVFAALAGDDQSTVEAHLFRALYHTRLIQSHTECGYSRSGRTDKGVSALGQVVSLVVRSAVKDGLGVIPPPAPAATAAEAASTAAAAAASDSTDGKAKPPAHAHNAKRGTKASTEPVELDYALLLNAVLPPDIRVVAWAPVQPQFSSRFQCLNRIYKYFFYGDGMDIELMRGASQALIGEHDFRNFCTMDVTNSSHFHRNVQFINIERVHESDEHKPEWSVPPHITASTLSVPAAAILPPQSLTAAAPAASAAIAVSASSARASPADSKHDSTHSSSASSSAVAASGSSVRAGYEDAYVLTIGGNAFLYHQVRCMCAILFLVGRRLEAPTIVKQLLNVEPANITASSPGFVKKPQYDAASDVPLVLFDCTYPTDAVRWIVSTESTERAFADWHANWRRTTATASIQRLFAAAFAQNLYAAQRRAAASTAAALSIPSGAASLDAIVPQLAGAQLARKSAKRRGGGSNAGPDPHVPLAKRKTEHSFEQKVAALAGKRLVHHMAVNVKSLQYREYNENRSKVLNATAAATANDSKSDAAAATAPPTQAKHSH